MILGVQIMRAYDMRAVYTIAAVPHDVDAEKAPRAIPLSVSMPYTLADAEVMVKRYNLNPIYTGLLRRFKCSHFVPFNLEALTMRPPAFYLEEY
jgi:hypothetical protein